MTALTVIICAHNPRPEYIEATLGSIRAQQHDASTEAYEFIIIDNASKIPLVETLDLSWHQNARIIVEDKLGLTHARLRSFHESRGDILLYIDDDNILEPNYFTEVMKAFGADEKLGAIGGKSIPRYEVEPPVWFAETGIGLACRDLGEERIDADWPDPTSPDRAYPTCAPIGAGMAIRRKAYATYVEMVETDPLRQSLGRKGTDLASGEDNDMIMSVLEQGYSIAYLPQLSLIHLIPGSRVTQAYLERYAFSSNRTWVQVLDVHGIRPWPAIAAWTSPLRKFRFYLRSKAWTSPVRKIAWKAVCGRLEGQASLER